MSINAVNVVHKLIGHVEIFILARSEETYIQEFRSIIQEAKHADKQTFLNTS